MSSLGLNAPSGVAAPVAKRACEQRGCATVGALLHLRQRYSHRKRAAAVEVPAIYTDGSMTFSVSIHVACSRSTLT